MTYEVSPQREVASANELLELHTVITHWLAVNGERFIEPEDANNVSEYDGLPISDNYPRLQTTVSGDKIRAVLPEAAETLGIGDELGLMYFFPHYQPSLSGEPSYQPPSSSLDIPAPEDDRVHPGGRTFWSEYDPGLASCGGSKSLMDSTLPENFDSRNEPITRSECEALVEIVSNLDVILGRVDSSS